MNKDIETRLKELKLASPSVEFRPKVLANAHAAWLAKNEVTVLHMQFRHVLALAASLVLFIGALAFLNWMEARDMRLAFGPRWENSKAHSENMKILEDMGFGREYSALIASVPGEKTMKPFFSRFEEFKLQ